MAFEPYNFYLDGKRKGQRWASVTPFILVGLLLLVMAIDGYLGYKSVHPKPKPVAEIVTVSCSGPAGCASEYKERRCYYGGFEYGGDNCAPVPSLQAFKERVSERDAYIASTMVLGRHASRKDKDLAAKAWEEGREESLKEWARAMDAGTVSGEKVKP